VYVRGSGQAPTPSKSDERRQQQIRRWRGQFRPRNHRGRPGERPSRRPRRDPFPPEPNGYLHIGHAKAICVDFGLAQEFGGTCNLRFDDTNPTTEDVEYVDAIQEDIRWLGFEWSKLFYASDYFEKLYQLAVKLIEKDRAYVDSLSEDEIREYRGDFYKKGKPSPYRNRPIAESLDLFKRMRAGRVPRGARTCCAARSISRRRT
jgi:glutaminyl-tRNA synthetase